MAPSVEHVSHIFRSYINVAVPGLPLKNLSLSLVCFGDLVLRHSGRNPNWEGLDVTAAEAHALPYPLQ